MHVARMTAIDDANGNMSSEWLQWPKEINDKWALNVIFLWALTWPSPDGWVWRSNVPDRAWRRRGSCGWSSVPSCSRPVPHGNPSCWRRCRPFPAETGCCCWPVTEVKAGNEPKLTGDKPKLYWRQTQTLPETNPNFIGDKPKLFQRLKSLNSFYWSMSCITSM